jgi:hypothetical protein
MEHLASTILCSLKTASVVLDDDDYNNNNDNDNNPNNGTSRGRGRSPKDSKPTVFKAMRKKPGPKPGWKKAKKEAELAAAAANWKKQSSYREDGTTTTTTSLSPFHTTNPATVTPPPPPSPFQQYTNNKKHNKQRLTRNSNPTDDYCYQQQQHDASNKHRTHFMPIQSSKPMSKSKSKTIKTHAKTPPSVSPPDNNNDYELVTHLTCYDVLSGRGNGIASLAGNVHFRQLVQEHRSDYNSFPRYQKSQVAEDIIQRIHELGGRFVEPLDNSNNDNNKNITSNKNSYYRVLEPHRVLEKTSQALRERCVHKVGRSSSSKSKSKYNKTTSSHRNRRK